MKSINGKKMKELMKEKKSKIIDVDTEHEFQKKHIEY